MLFNSISFAIFLPIVFSLYWILNKRLKWQNILLLVSSYYFYSCWDWRFSFLLLFSTFLDYFSGLQIAKTEDKNTRRFWFWLSILINLSFLGFFKYYNFFVGSFAELMSSLGIKVNPWTLEILLPVGISFYTFHGLSYVVDIYNRKIEPEKDPVIYALFVSFFPLLVAGPIERATHLLPQLKVNREFNYHKAVDGMRQILWGLFKKVVIADNCAHYANIIFNDYANVEYTGTTLAFGAFLFAIQIYCDFSGYSDIALGSARLFGIELLRNFNYPYFSRDIAEFWRRWHISLSTWFKDYLYIPLGGSRGGDWMRIRNTFIIFLVSGFWHGANWTFIFWGFLNALFIMPSIVMKTNRNNLDIVAQGKIFPSLKEFFQVLLTFGLATFCWIFFRAESISDAFSFIKKMFTTMHIGIGYPLKLIGGDLSLLFFIAIMFVFEWLMRDRLFPLRFEDKVKRPFRWMIYIFLTLLIIWFHGKEAEFIYFQF